MVSLLDQLIYDVTLSNPSLSSEEASNQITALIENEILPEALLRIKMSKLPSPLSLKQEELMRPRIRKDSRFSGESIQSKVRFIQDLEKLRSGFDGSDLTSEGLYSGLMASTQIPSGLDVRYDVELDGKLLESKPSILQERTEVTRTLESPERRKEIPRLIDFDMSIDEKVVRDPIYEKVIGEIESRIRAVYSHENLNIHFKFLIRIDMDDPDREKTVIRITLPNVKFDQKMEFWSKIETNIGDVLKKLNISDSEKKAIGRNLFTYIDPT